MNHKLLSKLEKIKDSINIDLPTDRHVTGIISGITEDNYNYELLIYQIRKLKNFCDQIVIPLPLIKNEIEEKIDTESDFFPIKLIKCSTKSNFDLTQLLNMLKQTLYDRILVINYLYKVSNGKFKSLLKHDSPLATFIGDSGNIVTSVFYIEKWKIKNYLRLLEMNNMNKIEDLFRLSPNTSYFKLSKHQKLSVFDTNTDFRLLNHHPNNEIHFKRTRIKKEPSKQHLIKILSILEILLNFNSRPKVLSKFKIQQLFLSLRSFMKLEYWNLVFQIVSLISIVKERIHIEFPKSWDFEKLMEIKRKALVNESNELAKFKLERLRYFCLENILENNFLKPTEKKWILDEKKRIRSSIENDNVFNPLV